MTNGPFEGLNDRNDRDRQERFNNLREVAAPRIRTPTRREVVRGRREGRRLARLSAGTTGKTSPQTKFFNKMNTLVRKVGVTHLKRKVIGSRGGPEGSIVTLQHPQEKWRQRKISNTNITPKKLYNTVERIRPRITNVQGRPRAINVKYNVLATEQSTIMPSDNVQSFYRRLGGHGARLGPAGAFPDTFAVRVKLNRNMFNELLTYNIDLTESELADKMDTFLIGASVTAMERAARKYVPTRTHTLLEAMLESIRILRGSITNPHFPLQAGVNTAHIVYSKPVNNMPTEWFTKSTARSGWFNLTVLAGRVAANKNIKGAVGRVADLIRRKFRQAGFPTNNASIPWGGSWYGLARSLFSISFK